MKIQYLSHSAFLIMTASGHSVLIDPFLDRNPKALVKSEQVDAQYIILSHAHGDHIGDTAKIAKRCGSTIICVDELANYFAEKGFKVHNMHIGGARLFPFGKVKFTMALHGSKTPDGQYAGNPAGILITADGKTLYHAGDTGLFYDMKLIGEMNDICAALLPIGGNFTMDVDDAVKAVEFLKPAIAVPMHFNTFPVIEADPRDFERKVKKIGVECRVMAAGDEIEL